MKKLGKFLKNYEALKALTKTTNNIEINIDKAVNIIFDTNKLVQSSTLSPKNSDRFLLKINVIFNNKKRLKSVN